MTINDLEKINKDFLNAEDVADIIDAKPQCIRSQAQSDPTKLGFPVIVTGTRVRIPKDGFIFFCRYGRPTQA